MVQIERGANKLNSLFRNLESFVEFYADEALLSLSLSNTRHFPLDQGKKYIQIRKADHVYYYIILFIMVLILIF